MFNEFCPLANRKNQKGFTLVEMLVSVLIFFIALSVCVDIFVSTVKLQRYNLSSQRMMDQTNYAFEYMARMIGMTIKDTDGSCTGAIGRNYRTSFTISGTVYSGLMFKNSVGACKAFFINGGILREYESSRQPEVLDLTSNEFNISNFSFSIYGDTAGDTLQPRVTVFFDIAARSINPAPRMRTQTTISQRNLDM